MKQEEMNMRRRPVTVQRRGPGLLGTMARTAVIAGTATAVSNSVSGSMNNSTIQQQQAQAYQAQQQQAAMDARYQQQQAAQNTQNKQQQTQTELEQMKAQMAAMQAQQMQQKVALGGGDFLGQLQKLAQLRETGVLNEEEFQAAKTKLLG
jgi:uncharacterized transporter YbjL